MESIATEKNNVDFTLNTSLQSSHTPFSGEEVQRSNTHSDIFEGILKLVPGITRNDFGYAISLLAAIPPIPLTAAQIAFYLQEHWKPTTENQFPCSTHKKGSKIYNRRLNGNHLKQFSWIGVSRHPDHEGVWCRFCVLFKTSDKISRNNFGRLIGAPLKNFGDLTGKNGSLTHHGETEFHKNCSIKAANFLHRLKNPSLEVENLVDSQYAVQVAKNRTILSAVIDTLKLLAVQNIPLRGHRDDKDFHLPNCEIINPVNDGMFTQNLYFIKLKLQVTFYDFQFVW